MQNTRLCTRLPRTLALVKAPIAAPTRKMSLFPRFITHDFVANDFAPVWRLLDNYANQAASTRQTSSPHQVRSFQPRFDVKEVEDGYEVKGDLPGVDQDNIAIEFPDQRTIVIKGATGNSREQGGLGGLTEQPDQQESEEGTPSEKSSHQVTVEDEPEYVDAAADAVPGTASGATPAQATPATAPAAQQEQPAKQSPGRYWISERHTGHFQRVFAFPAPVDIEKTTARLRNGILEVRIPKVPKAGVKRISIE